MNSRDDAIVNFEQRLTDEGIRGALAWLNHRVDYRFTALHLRREDSLQNVYVFDRTDPVEKPFLDAPVDEAYCAAVFSTGQPLVFNNDQDAPIHEQVSEPIKAYCGLPLHRPDGSIYGIVCHFDYQPHHIDTDELALMNTASQILSATLNRISEL